MTDQPEFFTTGEVAKLCGVTLRTVINWIQRGHLKAHKLPGTRGDNRIRRVDLIEFMSSNGIPLPETLTPENPMPREEPSPERDKVDRDLILVVDDDISMAKSIARVLRSTGKQILMAHNGFDAGVLYAERRPRLMTLDLQMPGVDGFAVLNSLANRKQGKILVISAMEERHLQKALTMGADDILPKPYEVEHLIEKATTLIER